MANQQEEEEIVQFVEADYEDMLEPGYRFSPTDSEIIVYYLKPHIETGEHPECRLYQVDIYKHTPDELAEQYRPCDNKWYFLTPRERKYENGDRPNRITKDSGRWKMSQSCGVVYDDMSGLPVGKKNSFAYYVEKDRKTPWLMLEYTTLDPNLPATGSGQERKKLTDWVICKIYKKEANQSTNKKRAAIRNQEDEPSPIRRRLSVNQGINVPNEAAHIQIQETNQHLGTEVQMAAHLNVNQQVLNKKETNQSTNKKRKAIWNQEEGNGEQNRYLDEPSPLRRRLSINQGINVPNEAVHIQIQETNHPSRTDANIVPITSTFTGYQTLLMAEDFSYNDLDGISLDDLDTPLDPYIPTESGQDNNKLTDPATSKIFSETNQTSKNNWAENFKDTSNEEGVNEEHNVGNNQPNEIQHVEYQEANCYSNQQSVDNIIMNDSPPNTIQQIDTFNISNPMESPVEESRQVFTGEEVQPSFGNSTFYYQNPSISTEPTAFEEPRQGEEVQPSTSDYYQNPSMTSYQTEPPADAFDYRSPTSMNSTGAFDEHARRFITNMLDRRSLGGYIV